MVSLSMGFELETVAWGAGGCFWSFVYQRSSCACLQPCPASLLLGLRESGGGRGATVVNKDLCRKGLSRLQGLGILRSEERMI